MIAPTGQQTTGGTVLYLVEASAMEYSNLDDFPSSDAGDVPLPTSQWQLNRQAWDYVLTNEDGSITGDELVQAAGGAPVLLKPTMGPNRRLQLMRGTATTSGDY